MRRSLQRTITRRYESDASLHTYTVIAGLHFRIWSNLFITRRVTSAIGRLDLFPRSTRPFSRQLDRSVGATRPTWGQLAGSTRPQGTTRCLRRVDPRGRQLPNPACPLPFGESSPPGLTRRSDLSPQESTRPLRHYRAPRHYIGAPFLSSKLSRPRRPDDRAV